MAASMTLCVPISEAISQRLKEALISAHIPSAFPEDTEYDSFTESSNLRYDFRPAVVTFPKNTDEVSIVVRIATQEDLNVVARSGGHSGIANSLGGRNNSVVVDLRNLTEITVDSSTPLATIGTGNRLGRIAQELDQHGRAMPHGTCPSVGIGGHSAFGGYGFTSRMWGLTLDAIQSITSVLADGSVTTASSEENPNLFWALRGTAPSFGITTSITFKTYPAPPDVTYFKYSWERVDSEVATSIVDRWQSHFTDSDSQRPIPSHLGTDAIVTTNAGNLEVHVLGGWFAPPPGFSEALAPLLHHVESPTNAKVIRGPWIRTVEEMAIDAGSSWLNDTTVYASKFWSTSLMTPRDVNGGELSRAAVESVIRWMAKEGERTTLTPTFWLQLFGGPSSAVNHVPWDATAYVNRGRTLNINLNVRDESEGGKAGEGDNAGYELLKGMKDQILQNMPEDWTYGSYPNDPDDRLSDWQNRYYGSSYSRLQCLKAKYDPEGRFSFPLGIELPSPDSMSSIIPDSIKKP